MKKKALKARDVDRLENTSLASILGVGVAEAVDVPNDGNTCTCDCQTCTCCFRPTEKSWACCDISLGLTVCELITTTAAWTRPAVEGQE